MALVFQVAVAGAAIGGAVVAGAAALWWGILRAIRMIDGN